MGVWLQFVYVPCAAGETEDVFVAGQVQCKPGFETDTRAAIDDVVLTEQLYVRGGIRQQMYNGPGSNLDHRLVLDTERFSEAPDTDTYIDTFHTKHSRNDEFGEKVSGRGLHSFPFQLNLCCSNHRITQIHS